MTLRAEQQAASRLRRALRDPAAWVDDERAARASFVLRGHALEAIDRALVDCAVPPLLVKGGSLALTVYPKPWQREMCDLDLLIHKSEREAALAALVQAGAVRLPDPPGRRFSLAALGEAQLLFELGPADVLVEVHTGLDKVVPRPIPYRSVARRSDPIADLENVRCPNAEDHALLVVLHAATSGFDHPRGLIDLELLLRLGLDADILVRRARAWRLQTALHLALRALHGLGSSSVQSEIIERLAPSVARRRLVEAFYEPGAFPTARRTLEPGLPWLLAQGPLRDDLGAWLLGVGRYAARRAVERSLARWLAHPRGSL